MKKPSLSKSLSDTRAIAKTFLASLKPSEHATVVALSGDLGAGKTAFTKELGNLLGIPHDQITSPTFVIMKILNIRHSAFEHLIHIDAYRLEDEQELVSLGWNEIAQDPKNLILIEWPEMVKGLIPKDARKLSLKFIDESTREITIL